MTAHSSLPANLPAFLRPGQLAGEAMRSPSLFPFAGPTAAEAAPAPTRFTPRDSVGAVQLPLPSRIPVGEQERRLTERLPAGPGRAAHAEILAPFKEVVSCTISALLHHLRNMLRHAAAQVCTAPGKCGDRDESDDGKRGHVMRSDVMRACEQFFLRRVPFLLGDFWGLASHQYQ